jgi:hypothetical protein
LYLSPFVHEPKLGVFLNENPDFVYRALSTDRFMHEQTFRWQGPRAGEPAIRPDLLVRRTDGTYDIYDLKTALLSRKVTRKSRARRMLDKDLEEGFAQLAHYYEYFIMPENAGYLRDVHGVQVVDPRLVLVTFPPKSMPL